MKVSEMPGERFRYTVHSESEDAADHVVDLSENKGNGACSCRDFEVRCGPNYFHNGGKPVHYRRDEKGKVNKDRTQCKHIREVRDYLLDSILPDMVKVVSHARPQVQTIRESEDGFPF